MENLSAEPYIKLDSYDFDKLVERNLGLKYSTIEAGLETIHNYTSQVYTLHDFDYLIKEVGTWSDELELWKQTAGDCFAHYPSWEHVLTLLIENGHVPKENYIISFFW